MVCWKKMSCPLSREQAPSHSKRNISGTYDNLDTSPQSLLFYPFDKSRHHCWLRCDEWQISKRRANKILKLDVYYGSEADLNGK
jgi:hypothetical protein